MWHQVFGTHFTKAWIHLASEGALFPPACHGVLVTLGMIENSLPLYFCAFFIRYQNNLSGPLAVNLNLVAVYFSIDAFSFLFLSPCPLVEIILYAFGVVKCHRNLERSAISRQSFALPPAVEAHPTYVDILHLLSRRCLLGQFGYE